ncbi:MAG: PP2C family protein-serine/threonine phosphatase [Thiobacillaceae bacterium]
MSRRLKVLVVDDVAANLHVMDQFLTQLGHTVVMAATGAEALQAFQTHQPDLVLMDVMLPDIDGLEATRRIRAMAGERWVPILYVSALTQREDILRGLDAGGDDYITKPVDLTLLEAKIRAMQRIAEIQARLAENARELARYREAAELEQATAHALMEKMIQAGSVEDPGLRLWLEPAARFSGDLLFAGRSRIGGQLYVLHADAMGHGLVAALPLLPIAQIFHAMTAQGMTLPVIVHEMNATLQRQIPQGFFVAATIAVIDRRNRTVEVWNGGNPDALLIDAQGAVLQRFPSEHLPLGIQPPERFAAHTRCWQLESGEANLILYSDGLAEARDRNGEAFGQDRLMSALSRGGDPHLAVVNAVKRHLDGARAHDDISLACVLC